MAGKAFHYFYNQCCTGREVVIGLESKVYKNNNWHNISLKQNHVIIPGQIKTHIFLLYAWSPGHYNYFIFCIAMYHYGFQLITKFPENIS